MRLSHGRFVKLPAAIILFATLTQAAGSDSPRGDCASLPTKPSTTQLHAEFSKHQIPLPQGACILNSGAATVGRELSTYAGAITRQHTIEELEAHFVRVLEAAGYKPTANATRDLVSNRPRVHLKYASPGATVMSRTVLKGTAISIVLIDDAGFAGWHSIRVSIQTRT